MLNGGVKGGLALSDITLQPITDAQGQLTFAVKRALRKSLCEGIEVKYSALQTIRVRGRVCDGLEKEIHAECGGTLLQPELASCQPGEVRRFGVGITSHIILQGLSGDGEATLDARK